MTSRLETMTVGKLAPVDVERQQRASAPTLRDLRALPEQASTNTSADTASGGSADCGSKMESP